jgi:hypothetical protein
MGRSSDQELVIQLLGSKPVSFNPDLVKVLGSVNAALFLSQLLYWQGKSRNPNWIYKTVKEFEIETGLSKSQQLYAQKRCVRMKILSVTHKGIPPKRHFHLDQANLIEALKDLRIEKASLKPKRLKRRHSNDTLSDE